ncbi:terminase large subunit [Acetobacter oeni]|nr:terminase large subunit [Acetobacter oeni]
MRPDAGGPVKGRRGRQKGGQSVRKAGLKHPHVTAADHYARDVVKGGIPACQWVRLACERYQRDRLKERDAEWPYRLDRARAEKICRFVSLMPHTKGKWALKRELIVLEPWQSFILVNIFGWVRKSDGLRRFRIATIVVPRKNGKSCLSAPVGLYMLAADGEFGAEVYCGATTEKQAWEVFRPASEMARRTPAYRSAYGVRVNASNINVLANGSRFEPLIGKPGDGSSPSCALVDEYHEHPTSELWDTMLTGMGARDQPLMWGITTAGDNLAGPCFDQILSGRKVLEQVFDDETLFFVEYTIDDDDDWTSPQALKKANPNIGISVSEEFLLTRQRDAIRNPRLQATFKTKHLNVWVNSRSGYFNIQSWNQCHDPAFSEAGYYGRDAVIGMDLASKNDIAALQVLIPMDDGRFATFGRYYLPEAVLDHPGNEHYRGWANSAEPSLVITDGNMIDFGRIEDDLDELRRLFTVSDIVFDPAQASMLVTRLMEKGATVTQFDQNARNYSEPMKQVAAEIDAGLIVHGCVQNHPMTWMLSNVEARLDAKDQVYPRKARPENKIDGPVALIMARSRFLTSNVSSVYEERGLISF